MVDYIHPVTGDIVQVWMSPTETYEYWKERYIRTGDEFAFQRMLATIPPEYEPTPIYDELRIAVLTQEKANAIMDGIYDPTGRT